MQNQNESQKPSMMTINLATLIQTGVYTINDVPKIMQAEVSKWLDFLINGKHQDAVMEVNDNEVR